MSVKLMSAIFETEFHDLPLPPEEGQETRMAKASSLKLVLLAIADHANDEGVSAYPGLTKLEKKTALSRQGAIDVISALKYNGLLSVSDVPSPLGTNDYSINTQVFTCLQDPSQDALLVKWLDYPSQATLPGVVKPLDLKHPLTTIKPPLEEVIDSANKSVDGYLSLLAKGQDKLSPRNAMWDRADKELSRIKYNLSGARQSEQDKFVSFLLREEKVGRTIERFVAWVFANEFWVGKISGLNKIMELWLNQEEAVQPELPTQVVSTEPEPVYTLPPEDRLAELKKKLEQRNE